MIQICCSSIQRPSSPFQLAENEKDIPEALSSCPLSVPRIFPSFDCVRKLTTIAERTLCENDNDIYGIPYIRALNMKDAFDSACQIPQESCRSKTFFEIVRNICQAQGSQSYLISLAYNVALTVISGSDKAQALGEVAVAAVRIGMYDILPAIAHEIVSINDHPIDIFRKVVKEISKSGGFEDLKKISAKIELSVLKTEVGAEVAISYAKNGETAKAEELLQKIRQETSSRGLITPEISSMLNEVEDAILCAQTIALSCDSTTVNSQMYVRLLRQIESTGHLPELTEEEQNMSQERDMFIVLGRRAARANRFQDVIRIGKAISEDMVENDLIKKYMIQRIVEYLAAMQFDGKEDTIAHLLDSVHADGDSAFSMLITARTDETTKFEIGVAVAKKLLKADSLEEFFKKIIAELYLYKHLSRIPWLLAQLDESDTELRHKLIIFLTKFLNEEGQERALDLVKKIYGNDSTPMEQQLETFIRIVIAAAREEAYQTKTYWDVEKTILHIEQVIRTEWRFALASEPGDQLSQNVYRLITQALIREGKLYEAELDRVEYGGPNLVALLFILPTRAYHVKKSAYIVPFFN